MEEGVWREWRKGVGRKRGRKKGGGGNGRRVLEGRREMKKKGNGREIGGENGEIQENRDKSVFTKSDPHTTHQ